MRQQLSTWHVREQGPFVPHRPSDVDPAGRRALQRVCTRASVIVQSLRTTRSMHSGRKTVLIDPGGRHEDCVDREE